MDDDTITDEDGWLELRVGATASVFGKLDSVGYGAPGTIIISFADWAQLVIECDHPRRIRPDLIPLSAHVMVRVTRTEDGLKAHAIWELGGVPIPLTPAAEP